MIALHLEIHDDTEWNEWRRRNNRNYKQKYVRQKVIDELEREATIAEWYREDGSVAQFEAKEVSVKFFSTVFDPSNEKTSDLLADTGAWGSEIGEKEQFTGNEGATRELTYEKYMLAFWPKNRAFDMLMNMKFESAIDLVHRNMNQDNDFFKKLEILVKRLVDDEDESIDIYNDFVIKMLEMLNKSGDLDLTLLFLEYWHFSHEHYFHYYANHLSILIGTFGWETLKICDCFSRLRSVVAKCNLVKV